MNRTHPSGPPVVVLGADCRTGLQAARIFAARNVEVIGVASDPTHPCARGRAYSRMVPRTSEGEGNIAALLDLAPELPDGAVLLPCTDLDVIAVSRQRAALAGTYRMALPPPEVVELLVDKARFAEFAVEHSLPIPRTRVLRTRDDAVDASREFAFPCLLKPSIKTGSWMRNAAGKVLIVESPASLVRSYERCSSWNATLVMQEWIAGQDLDHYTCNCYLGSTGEPLATFCTRKLRQWPPRVGQGCLSVECRNPSVRDTTLNLFRLAGHRGLGYLEMKRDPASGRHLIIEANVGRPTGRSAAAEAAGLEFLMTMYCDLAGLPLPEQREQRFRGVKWIDLRHDLQACVQLLRGREESVGGILRSWKGSRTFALFSWRDPVPFVADVTRALRKGATPTAASPSRPALTHPVSPSPVSPSPVSSDPVPSGPESVLDFLVGGLIRVRASGAGPADLNAVIRELGPPTAARDGLPDITLDFEDHVASVGVGLLDGGNLAYGPDGLYALDSPAGPVQARLCTGDGWGHGRIVCRSGLSRVPFLAGMVDLAAIERGWIPLHASAWSVNGTGILAAGWARSGKTGAMLSFAERGAGLLGDDRVFLSGDGRKMVGVPSPVHVRAWHLAQLPALANRIGGRGRAAARFGSAVERLAEGTDRRLGNGGGLWRKVVARGSGRLRRRMGVELPLGGIGSEASGPASADLLMLLETHDHPSIRSEPLTACTMAGRITAMVHADLMPMLRTDLCVRYAGGGGWSGLEQLPDRISHLATRATNGRTGYIVRHPYPCSLQELRARVGALLGGAVVSGSTP